MSSNNFTAPKSGIYTVSSSSGVDLRAININDPIYTTVNISDYNYLEDVSTEDLKAELLRRTSLGKELE